MANSELQAPPERLAGSRPGAAAPAGTRRGAAARAAVTLLGLLLLAGCGFGSPNEPGTFDYSGTWGGTLSDDANGAGTMLVTLQQSGHALAGTWHAVVAGDPARQDGGSWSGELFVGQERDLLEANLSPAVAGQCSYRLTLTRTNEGMSGDYAAVGAAPVCAQLTRGSVQLSKQQ